MFVRIHATPILWKKTLYRKMFSHLSAIKQKEKCQDVGNKKCFLVNLSKTKNKVDRKMS